MRAFGLVLMLVITPSIVRPQSTLAPDECYRFAFSAWDPPLNSVANTYNPGHDPTTGAPAGAPRDWAARLGDVKTKGEPSDSVLLLFPAWWPAGVSIDWREQHGDTLLGRAIALVADGRVKNPVSTVRATRVPCRKPEPGRPDATGARPR
jgi:hypothetical protein